MVIRCIFVGVRRRGRLLIDTFTTDRRFEAAALVDDSVGICRQAIADSDWADLPCYAALEAALAAVPADAVVFMGHRDGRADAVLAALKMGLHVFVANPLAQTLAEARELVATASDLRLGLVVDPQQRYGVTERTLAGWRRERRHGALRAARLSMSIDVPAPDGPALWERTAAHLSALLPTVGWGIHQVSVEGLDEHVLDARLVLRDKSVCSYHVDCLGTGVELRLDFERASVRAVGSEPHQKSLELALTQDRFESIGIRDDDDPDPAERFAKESFYQIVTQGGRVAADGPEHLQTLAVTDALQRAAHSGQPVAVSL